MDIRTELAQIPVPRIDRCKKHLLVDILLLCIIAMVCGVESVEDIVFFGETHEDWLRKYLALPHGIPGADTILRVLGRIDHRKFEGCFLSWTRGCFRERMSAGSVIAVDGKTVRGSENGERKAIHIVSAWADEVGQVQTVEKSNEITVIPALLEMIALKGCMVTIDAMGCQYKIANQIVSAGANYVTSLPADPALFGASVRAHWGIENSLHYVLDVAFGEDACRIKSGNAPENLAFIRKIARSMARSDTQSSRSITSRIKQMA